MERRHTFPATPPGDAFPGSAGTAARRRLASLHGPAQTPSSAPGRWAGSASVSGSAAGSAAGSASALADDRIPSPPGGLPLSEAIAAQYFARRPWWRKIGEGLGERVPSTLRGRWALEFRAAVALVVLAVVGAAVGGWYLWRSQATIVELPVASTSGTASVLSQDPVVSMPTALTSSFTSSSAGTSATATATSATSATLTSATTTLVVDVEGKVAHPGIQSLPPGSRVYEALRAAGGALPGVDATGLDLARPLVDGEQLRIALPGSPLPPAGLPTPPAPAGHGKRGKPAQPVDLNTATPEQLQTIPGVGPAMAQRILDYRAQHGRFTTVAELRQIKGIGERKFADMKDSVTV